MAEPLLGNVTEFRLKEGVPKADYVDPDPDPDPTGSKCFCPDPDPHFCWIRIRIRAKKFPFHDNLNTPFGLLPLQIVTQFVDMARDKLQMA